MTGRVSVSMHHEWMGGVERGGAGYSAALVYAKQIQRLT